MKFIILSITVFFSLITNAQNHASLDINNVKADFNFLGPMLNNPNHYAGFECPKGSGQTTIYASGFWMAGLDGLNQTRTAISYYGQGQDFKGSIDTNLHRLFKVDRDTIDYHINNFQNPGYVVPDQIDVWPAHGNPSLNMPFYMAPFVDVDNDGVYEPAHGDYPDIKGDQAIWWFMTDSTVHTESGGLPFYMEMYCMAYAYGCPQDSALANTVFVDFKIKNTSGRDYYDVWIGNWVDFDIGCSGDDYVGCDIEKGVFYGYNADLIDDEVCSGATPYSSLPPATGAMIFGPDQDNDGVDNPGPTWNNAYTVSYSTAIADNGVCYKGSGLHYGDGIADNERLGLRKFMTYSGGSTPGVYGYPQTDPQYSVEFYRYLKGLWQDGSQLVYGGGGYAANGGANPSVDCDYMYPGLSDPQNWNVGPVIPSLLFDWTEYNTSSSGGANPKGDRRGLGSSGPFTFLNNQTETITFAYVYGRDYVDSSYRASVDVMLNRADYINGFIEQNLSCGQPVNIQEIEVQKSEFEMYPNPADNIVNLKFDELPAKVEVIDLPGKLFINMQPKSTQAMMDVSSLPAGIYLIRVYSQDGYISTKKLVIR